MKKTPATLHIHKKAFHEYEIQDTHEAGIQLLGPEVRSIRAGNCNLKGAYAVIRNAQMWVTGMHIAHYEFSQENIDPLRDRKVFLHKRVILRLGMKSKESGMTLIPTKLYLKNNRIKIQIALAKGKKMYQKKETLKRRDQEREQRRDLHKT